MDKNAKIYVAGHTGLVGSALMRALAVQGYQHVVTASHESLDLTHQPSVQQFFEKEQPEFVFLAAAKVGGILANNNYPGQFIQQNLAIQTHVIHEAWRAGVKRLLFLGSSCIYPKVCPQPIREDYLLTGPLEETNRPYAIAKIAGIEMCSAYNRQYGTQFLAVMPTNLYGPGDNYDLENSHVLPALIRKFHEAKTQEKDHVMLWGTGTPKREFLYSDDMANACLYLSNLADDQYTTLLSGTDSMSHPLINVGCGKDITIQELAILVKEIVGYTGNILWDASKPDGTLRKLLDVSRLTHLGWQASTDLKSGIAKAYQQFRELA